MAETVAENAGIVFSALYRGERGHQFPGAEIAEATGLAASEINDAVTILEENGYAERMRFLGTAPFQFGYVTITARGRVEYERARSAALADQRDGAALEKDSRVAKVGTDHPPTIGHSVVPIGSPYGFQDEDWEIVADRRGSSECLNVVLGYQFESREYDSAKLLTNIQAMFQEAVESYNRLPNAVQATLSFRSLSAGYGEHLFNEIARDIISADIAAFETSDLNSNVMIELGVALTWGIRVLVLKTAACPRPPSDISGQTWADYEESAARFTDPGHREKLVRMVERAIRKKSRS